MNRRYLLSIFFLALGCVWAADQRVPWTGSRFIGTPWPAPPYTIKRVYPELKFTDPVDMAFQPETGRFFILELSGKLFSFAKTAHSISSPDLAYDLRSRVEGLDMAYGLTFHPGFRTNSQLFLCYALKPNNPQGSKVSRFKLLTSSNPPAIDPKSEEVILTFLSGGHNGGCLKFGPDGYLYISTGDAAGPNPPDPLDTGQDVSDLLASILRIDVEKPTGSKLYSVPADNPFVNLAPAVRPEIWAYGFRNPWKMSFDFPTGALWTADVGWELWELVYRVEKGGNYGWSAVEGRQPIKTGGKRGPTPILPPTVDHPHSEAASITGGFVYRGKRHPTLVGAYIYGDWETGKIWALYHDGTKVTELKEIADTSARIITFGVDDENELYIVDYAGGIYVLEPNPAAAGNAAFPKALSATGLFSDVQRLEPAAGVYSYSIHAERWADGAASHRWIALPQGSTVDTKNQKWVFPTNSVLAKTYSLPVAAGGNRKIETQVLHFDGSAWNGYSYRWNQEQSDATLVLEGSQEIVQSPSGSQLWKFASSAECLRCHNSWSGPPLAMNFSQLSLTNQLARFSALQLINQLPKENDKSTQVLETAKKSLEERARIYLHANCAHCHRENAGGSVPTVLNIELPLERTRTVDTLPTQGQFGITHGKLISPGDPFRSVLYYRLNTLGKGRMPHLGSAEVDQAGVKLIHDWIVSLAPSKGGASRPETNLFTEANELLAETPGALKLLHAISESRFSQQEREKLIGMAVAHTNAFTRDLFARFRPAAERKSQLEEKWSLATIANMPGDPQRGYDLFFADSGLHCFQCHVVKGKGRNLGPDLSQIGSKYPKQQLLEQITLPSKIIDPLYRTFSVETRDGLNYSGFLVATNNQAVTLRDAALQEVTIFTQNIESIRALNISAMPEGLLQSSKAQEAADLLAYLSSLR